MATQGISRFKPINKLAIALPLLFLSVCSYGQNFAVAMDKVNVLYEFIDNPLTVVAENCTC